MTQLPAVMFLRVRGYITKKFYSDCISSWGTLNIASSPNPVGSSTRGGAEHGSGGGVQRLDLLKYPRT
jgi:hypothetical protein